MADTINLDATRKIISVQGLDHYHEKAMSEVDEKISKISKTGVGAKGTGAYAEVFNDTDNNIAYGDYSHAEGGGTKTLGSFSHAEGEYTVASGSDSHVGGYKSQANAIYSFVHGYEAEATQPNEVAFGTYNQSNTDTLFSIGNGIDENNKSNAFEITKTTGILFDKEIATKEDIPTSLPADGGNADTAKSIICDNIVGTSGSNKYHTILDWANAQKGSAWAFIVAGYGVPADAPKSDSEAVLRVESDVSSQRKIVTWVRYGNAASLSCKRSIFNGSWLDDEWRGSNAGTVNGRHSGRIATQNADGAYFDAESENINDAYLQWDGKKYFVLKTNGGNLTMTNNCDTLSGIPADGFVKTSHEAWENQIKIPNDVDVPCWIANNAKLYTRYYTDPENNGLTNVPGGASNDFVWYYYDGLNIIATCNITRKVWTSCVVNGVFGGWSLLSEGGNAASVGVYTEAKLAALEARIAALEGKINSATESDESNPNEETIVG